MLQHIEEYARNLSDEPDLDIVIDEQPFVEELLDTLDCDRIIFLRGLERLLQNAKKIDVQYDEKWEKRFTGPVWNLYKLLADDFLYSNLEYDEYEKRKQRHIEVYAEKITNTGVVELVKITNAILGDIVDSHEAYRINYRLGLIAQKLDEVRLKVFLDTFLTDGSKITIRPWTVLETLIKNDQSYGLLSRLKGTEFPQRNEWLFGYFSALPGNAVNQHHLDEFMSFLKSDEDKSIKSVYNRDLRVLHKFLRLEPNIYPIACSIIYEKRHYSESIVLSYFGSMFHKQSYSPEELITIFKEDLELLQNIYFYTLLNGRLIDYTGEILEVFIEIDESWLQKYAEVFWNSRGNGTYYQNIALWKSDNYIKYYDYLFNCYPKKRLYNWHIRDIFISMISHTSGDPLVRVRQKEWLMHLIKENAHSPHIIVVFDMLCELSDDLRRTGVEVFLKNNDDYDMFKELSLLPSHWSGTDSFIPAYQKQIDFLESLYPLVPGIKFLKHKTRIRGLADQLKKDIKEEEVNVIYQHLYM